MSIEKEQARFEAAKSGDLDLSKRPDGEYNYFVTGLMWAGWWACHCDMSVRTEREDWMP